MTAASDPSTARFALARAPGLHADHLHGLGENEPAESLPGRPEAELLALGLRASAASWLAAPDWRRVEADRAWAEREGVQLLCASESEFPAFLALTPRAPAVLWVRGDPSALLAPQVAIVGSRRPTHAGLRNARDFAAELSLAGLVVTSGLALGIDAAAHIGALDAGGRSVAVCGTGLDTCYPPRHAALARRLAAAGALVSEFPPGIEPRAEHFPRRNRIISALAMGVVVVEAARDSGSLITARLAGEQGRHIMAVPGSIHSPVSHGCHELLRSGAVLVESAEHVLQEVGWQPRRGIPDQGVTDTSHEAPPVRRLDKAGEMLLDALGFEPASIDELIARTGQLAQDIAVRLSLLELEGLVEALPGGLYGRNSHPAPRKVN